ncbi:MAG: hypothetical protein F7C38_05410 [Desulfurococcales archaeon]|nr:hypothetical protein [Desulfurococcales archaeon]
MYVFPVKAGTLVGVVVLMLGLLFLAIGILPFVMDGNMSTIPIPVRLVFAIVGFIATIGGIYQIRYGPAMSRILKRLSMEVGVEDDRLVLPRRFRLKRGTLSISLVERNKRYETRLSFNESEDQEVTRETLSPEDFAEAESIAANVDWSRVVVGAGPVSIGSARSIVEWVNLPCYIVREREYATPVFDVCIALYRKPSLPIAIGRRTLQVSHERDIARAEIDVEDGVIRGRLEYYRAPGSKSRGARVEITGVYEGIKYKARITETREPGSIEFKWPAKPEEPIYVILSNAGVVSINGFLKSLGVTEPVMLGRVWHGLKDAKIRLVLDIAMAKDAVDEEDITVLPRAHTSDESIAAT